MRLFLLSFIAIKMTTAIGLSINDNPDITFDVIEVHRPELANLYLSSLKAQPGRLIALFAPRRVGKTYFLDIDLPPACY